MEGLTKGLGELTAARLSMLVEAGIIVNVCCGGSGHILSPDIPIDLDADDMIWSVACLNRRRVEFARPFAATDIDHAIEVAMIECRERGWV